MLYLLETSVSLYLVCAFPFTNTKVNVLHGPYSFKYLCLILSPKVPVPPYVLFLNHKFPMVQSIKVKPYYFYETFTYTYINYDD